MSVGFSRPSNPAALPGQVVWTLRHGTCTVEARTRMTPLGPELRAYVTSREMGELTLLWSQIPRDGSEVGELGDVHRGMYEAKGYRR